MYNIEHLLFCIVCNQNWLSVFLSPASAQSFSCDADVSKPLCPGTVVTCTCLVTGTVSYTQWIFNRLCPTARNYLAIQQVTPCANLSGTCGPYITATNYASSTSACQISKLKVTMATGVNGLTTECRDTTTGLPGTFIGNGSFTVLGKLNKTSNTHLSSVEVPV